jgi:hypothetical protein
MTTTLSATVDTAPGAKPGTNPFRIQGLSAELVNTIGTETTRKKLISDVEGGPLTANGIKFQTVVLGTAPGPDGKPMDVTRTAINGEFNLTRLGFINPDLTLTDAKGKTTTIGGYGSSIEIAGIKPKFMPNGTIALPIDSVIAKELQIKKGDMTVKLPLLEIKTIAMGLRGQGTEAGIEMLATKIGQIHFKDLQIEIIKKRKAELSDAEYEEALKEFEEEKAAAKKSGKLIADALSGLHGDINGEVSVDNWEDPDIHAHIEGGQLNFADLTNYGVWMKQEDVEREGVTRPEHKIVLGGFEIDLVEFKRLMPGFHGGSWESGSSGVINFKELVEGLVNEPPTAPERKFEPSAGLSKLIDFSGQLSLGDGKIGMDENGDAVLGAGDTWVELRRDAPDENVINLEAKNIGEELKLNIPKLHFSGAGFTAGKTQEGKVREGKTGDIKFVDVGVKVEGLAHFTLTITLTVKDGEINDITIGDVTFVDPAELSKLTAPDVTAVNPKGVPK